MNSLTHLLSWRYLTQSTDTHSISTMVYICFLGIFISSFSLTLVNAITNGFEYTMHKKMQGIHAHIIIRGYGDILNVEAIQQVLSLRFPEVVASCPSTCEHAILQSAQSNNPTIAVIKAINPLQETLVTEFKETIIHTIHPSRDLTALLSANQILVGSELASSLGITIGDEIELLHTDVPTIRQRTVTLNATKALVSGIFKTGIDECDNTLVITSFNFLNSLFSESGPTQLNIKLKDRVNEQQVIQKLTQELKLDIVSWHDLYPAIVSAFALEKYAMFLIMILIMLIASMNIIALLFMLITQKKPDIAILKAMGIPNATIERLFMYIGISIALSAAIPGIVLALLVSFALNRYRLITLPDAYYVSYLPTHLEWYTVLLILFAILIISFITVKVATRKTRTINISHVLRFEG